MKLNNLTKSYVYLNNVHNTAIYLNQFLKESYGYIFNVTNVCWDNGTVGNYWESNVNFVDSNNDYICEVPYNNLDTIYGDIYYTGAQDSHPLLPQYFGLDIYTGGDDANNSTNSISTITTTRSTSSQSLTSSITIVTTGAVNIGIIVVTLLLMTSIIYKRKRY